MNALELTGRVRSHVVQKTAPRFAAQEEVVEAFMAMRAAAAQDGFDLLPFSSFRDFDTQCRIWNQKFVGKKPLYDESGQPRRFSCLSPAQVIDCILNWSAVPGGSRHHWGTEIDVVDANVMPTGYTVQLLPQEVEPGGIFRPLHRWLDEHIGEFGFFRPYAQYKGGMFCEPWHLSYAPLSVPALESLTLDMVVEAIESAALEGKEILLQRMPEIFANHIRNICAPDHQ